MFVLPYFFCLYVVKIVLVLREGKKAAVTFEKTCIVSFHPHILFTGKIALLSRVFISFLVLLREKSSFVPSPHKQTRRGAESLETNSARGGIHLAVSFFVVG